MRTWKVGQLFPVVIHLHLFLFPLRHMKRPALQNKQAGVLRMALRARKAFGTFEKRAPGIKRAIFVCLIDWVFVFFFWSFFFFFAFLLLFFHFREHVELYQSGCVIKEFFPPDRMLVVMWRWRENLIRSLTFLSSVMRSIKGEWVLFQSVVDVYLFA